MVVSREDTCGLFGWRPSFLQPLASKKVYMFFYGMLGIIQGMFFTYLSATLSTLERKFGIKSKEAAYLMSGNEISQILFLFAMPFMVRVQRRPLWTAVGLMATALGCFMMAIPHLISGDYDALDADAIAQNANRSSVAGLCGSDYHPASLEHACDETGKRRTDWVGLVIVFLGIVLTGVGNSVFYSFGIAYLDDNTSHENSPIMLGITYTFRLLGPTLGFFLGSFCLRTYVKPSVDPGFSEGDPRWLGAWWLGYPIIGALVVIFAWPLACFPQRLPKKGTDAHIRTRESEKLKTKLDDVDEVTTPAKTDDNFGLPMDSFAGFWQAMLRLLRNKLFMYNFFSSIFYVFAFMGFGTFMPKYVEYQYRKKGSSSSSFAGGVGTISKALGLLISGFLISKFKPRARFLSGYNVLLGFFYFAALIVFAFLGCPTSRVYGTTNEAGTIDVSSNCNLDCGCPMARPQPICSKDGVTNFYSPCQAGCTAKSMFVPRPNPFSKEPPKSLQVYSDCGCVLEAWQRDQTSLSEQWVRNDHLADWDFPADDVIKTVSEGVAGTPIDQAVEGWCTVDCDGIFKLFMICMFILMVLGSTGRIGNVLVALRCIDVEDKSLSMAFNIVFMSLFAMLPGPMVYGAVIDNTCILWQEECGETTNCLLYDTDRLRVVLMVTTACIMLVGVLFDVGVWYYSKDLLIFNPDQERLKKQVDVVIEGADGGGGKEENGGLLNGKLKVLDQYASNVSLRRDSIFLGGPVTAGQ